MTLALLGLLLAACTGSAGVETTAVEPPASESTLADVTASTAPSTSEGGEPTGAEVSRGGTLVVSPRSELGSFDPLFGTGQGSDRHLYNMFYDPLIRTELDGSLSPWLATSWEFSDDDTVLTLELRDDVSFHDGTPFNADAVVQNIERAINPDIPSTRGVDIRQIESVEAVDDYRVALHLLAPSGALLPALGTEAGMMVSPTAFDAAGGEVAREPAGTGPFLFNGFHSGNNFSAVANPDYWASDEQGEQLPYLDQVDVNFIVDPSVKFTALRTGEIHLTTDLELSQLEEVEENPELEVIDSGSGTHAWVAMNVSEAPFDNKALRDALVWAIDRQTMASIVAGEYGIVTPTIVPPTSWEFDPDLRVPGYDPEQARAHLDEAGYADGITVTLSMINRELDLQMAQILQSMLAEIGITLEINSMERQAWIDAVGGGDFEVALLGITLPRPDPGLTFPVTFGRDATQNWAQLQDEALFDVIDRAQLSVDQEERKELYSQAQQLLLDGSYYAFLFLRPQLYGVNIQVQGLTMDIDGKWRFHTVWLDN